METLRAPRPHDLLRLLGAAAPSLPVDAPVWTRDALLAAPWVVVRRCTAPAGLIPVGIRGTTRYQRYPWLVTPDQVHHTVTPEDLSLADLPAGRDLPATRTLAAIRTTLHDMDVQWGPTGSVGFELATGIPTATSASDLDLVVRAPADPALLVALHHRLAGLDARVDCQVETRWGVVALAEMVSECGEVLMRTATGPLLVSRDVAVP
jgi:phosphoribosyl-dephospho-CoA transferase